MSSSRRSGHEDSILAKLEREPARRAGARTGLRLVWYGSAALAAVGLTATLALLAADSGMQTVEVAQVSESRPAPIGGAVSQLQEIQPDPQHAPAPARETTSALIVDAAPEPAPALRMLDGTNASPTPLKVAAAAVRETRLEARAEPRPEPRPEARREHRPEPRTVARSEARPAPGRPRNASVRPPARQSARARTINPARSGEHDDSDVALISAVIYHANGHAAGDGNDESTSSCADDACRPRPARQ